MLNLAQIRKNSRKVLGRNERSLEYIRPNNSRKAIEIADDKILTKKILLKNKIPVPKRLGVIKNAREIEEFDFDSEDSPKSMVIKPVHGLMGSGIEIFYNKDKNGNYIKADGSRVSVASLKSYMRDILDGRYSLFNEPDQILIEERVKLHKAFRYYAYKGAPDVRVLVYNNIPVMSYLRLPTKESEGKANLDKGAIGAGIDMAVGKTTNAIIGKSNEIEYVPGTKLPVSGIRIPYWDSILENAIKASKASGLGYAAIDFLLDREQGPLIVELNARPGLSIQLSNEDGLRRRLKKAGGINVKTVAQGIRLAKDMFGGEIETDIEAISGKKVIGIYETIKVIGVNGREQLTKAKIDTGADSTSIDMNIAKRLGYEEIIEEFANLQIPETFTKQEGKDLMEKLSEKLTSKYEYLADINLIKSSHGMSLRPLIKIELELDGLRFETKATIYDRSNLTYPVIVGRKSLYKYLVDPSKNLKV